MNELTPSHPAPPPQSRGLAAPYAFSANAMGANVVNVAAMDRAKSFQGVPRGNGNPKYQQLQHVTDYHTGAGHYATNYSHLKSPVDSRSSGTKFDYTPSQPFAQQSYGTPYGGYPSYTQNYGGEYQQQQPTQQQFHGGYESNPLGMLVSSATNHQTPPDAMPHEAVNVGLKEAGERKFRQNYGVVASDSFLNPSGGYGIERPGNVVQIKTTPSSSHQQQQVMHQRSNMYGGGGAYFPQQQRTQESSHQHNPLDLVPPSTMGAGFDTNGNGGVSSAMGRNMHNNAGGMFPAGLRMPQFSSNNSNSSLTTRLKDGNMDISTGSSSNGGHLPYMQKSLEVTHPFSDGTSSTTAMVSLSSDGPATTSGNVNAMYPPTSQLNASGEDACILCSGAHSDRIANNCGHRFHAQCLHSWGATTCPVCVQASNSITNLPQGLNNGGTINNSTGNNVMSISPTSGGSSQMSAMNNLQVSNAMSGTRPPPIDTRFGDTRVGPTILSGGKRSSTSTRSGSSSGGRVRKNKKLKDCSVPGCDRTVRSRGLCKGHGGGRRCGFSGCGLSDQGGGFCISHGGGKRCQHDGCDNSAQSRGLCKLHGGGSRCTVPNCTKSSQGRGLCRAHGGGRRCMVEGCNKTDRRAGFCVTHGADKKCIIPECSKTGRIDNMCTKHYFERHPAQPPGTVSTTPPPVITVNANTSAARARAERKKAEEQATAMAAATNYSGTSGSVPNAPFYGDGRVNGAMAKSEPF